MIMDLIRGALPKKPEPYVIIIEGKIGLECFADEPRIRALEKPYQEQLKAFIKSIEEALKKK